jgi:hypothetical protein
MTKAYPSFHLVIQFNIFKLVTNLEAIIRKGIIDISRALIVEGKCVTCKLICTIFLKNE